LAGAVMGRSRLPMDESGRVCNGAADVEGRG
jgi:hypothetical protein